MYSIQIGFLFLVVGLVCPCWAIAKSPKQLSLFNVVKFPNLPCQGNSNRNGTCFTKEQCDEKSGLSQGSCADGYGVCCIVELGCGGTTSVNCSYLTLSTSTPRRSCVYSICTAGKNICRIRFDFLTFDIAPPVLGKTDGSGAGDVGAIGHCVTDKFVIGSTGNTGSPIICGFNTNQHVYVDAPSGGCVTPMFTFSDDAYARKYDIKVSQFECGSDKGGPPDCLQYFTAISGEVASFNFLTQSPTVTSTATHLANQRYTMCFRRASGYCTVCVYPKIVVTTPAAISQNSFGLFTSADAALIKSNTNGGCDDLLNIPFGVASTDAGANTAALNTQGVDRVCGRFLHTEKSVTTTISICTNRRPFALFFATSDTELFDAATAKNSDVKGAPSGLIGFHLTYKQLPCA